MFGFYIFSCVMCLIIWSMMIINIMREVLRDYQWMDDVKYNQPFEETIMVYAILLLVSCIPIGNFIIVCVIYTDFDKIKSSVKEVVVQKYTKAKNGGITDESVQ